MENNHLILNLNIVEIVFITIILVYSFWFGEKKYFNILVLSVINKILVKIRGKVTHKKTEDK